MKNKPQDNFYDEPQEWEEPQQENWEGKYKKDFEEIIKSVILAIKILNPSLTDDEAKNAIVNLGNYIQLQRLKKETK
jgi:hypothetical protein